MCSGKNLLAIQKGMIAQDQLLANNKQGNKIKQKHQLLLAVTDKY